MFSEQHMQAAALIERGEPADALRIVNKILSFNFDDPGALFLLGNIEAKVEHYAQAALAYERAMALAPTKHQIVNNLGMALEGLGREVEARKYFMRAHKMAPTHPNYLINIGMTYITDDVVEAEKWAERAVEAAPESPMARTCRGFARLAQKQWAGGWDDYRYALGGKFREKVDFGLPDWNGEQGAHILVVGEQGIGDEVMVAQCLPELQARSASVTVECDARLARIFGRSFPDITIHGTRRQDKSWFDNCPATHQIMACDMPRIFRRTDESFPRRRYLRTDPDLVGMYEALQYPHAGDRLRVGLCTMGGHMPYNMRKRAVGAEAFKPLIDRYGDTCAFFSLDYRNDAELRIDASHLPIKHHHFVVGQGSDFDHLSAYIEALDVVVGIHTTAFHVAGALGKRAVAFVPSRPTWQYGVGLGDDMPWYQQVKLFRQTRAEDWARTIHRFAAHDAQSHLRRV
jgi:hypothetical protein